MVIQYIQSIGITVTCHNLCQALLATAMARAFRVGPPVCALSGPQSLLTLHTPQACSSLTNTILFFQHLQMLSTNLYIFADASLKAYGTVAYIPQGQDSPSILMSKTRAAPLKQLSLPKLELNSALVAILLSQTEIDLEQSDQNGHTER